MRRPLFFVPLIALVGCAPNTGFELQIAPVSTWTVPADFDSIRVQVTTEIDSSSGEDDQQPMGDTYPVTTTQPQYVILVLANGTQYSMAKSITVTLLKGTTTFKTFTTGDIPIQEGELKPVAIDFGS